MKIRRFSFYFAQTRGRKQVTRTKCINCTKQFISKYNQYITDIINNIMYIYYSFFSLSLSPFLLLPISLSLVLPAIWYWMSSMNTLIIYLFSHFFYRLCYLHSLYSHIIYYNSLNFYHSKLYLNFFIHIFVNREFVFLQLSAPKLKNCKTSI